MREITPFLWFDGDAEEAIAFYQGLFGGDGPRDVSRYGPGAPFPEGTVLTATFDLGGRPYTALNGGPEFPFTEAFSLMVPCDSQEEVDRLWDALTHGGGQESRCGWCKDRFGLSWQIVPTRLGELLGDPDPERSGRALQAMLGMSKIVVAELERAADGVS